MSKEESVFQHLLSLLAQGAKRAEVRISLDEVVENTLRIEYADRPAHNRKRSITRLVYIERAQLETFGPDFSLQRTLATMKKELDLS